MYKYITFVAFVLTTKAMAQDTQVDPISVNLQVGLNNPINPMANSYDARTLGLFQTSVAGRYMFNSKFGTSARLGYDHFSSSSNSSYFKTNYYNISLEGVMNLGNIFHFHEWSRRFGLSLHTGFGYSTMKGVGSDQKFDEMLHGLIGLTPIVKVNERWSVSIDFTSYAHVYQTRTYDFTQTYNKRGVDGFLFNMSFGVTYSIGKGTSADWFVPLDIENELGLMQQRITELEEKQKDDDGDGVANYLDAEANTPPGTVVNTKGQTVSGDTDSDADGIFDKEDACPFEKGVLGAKGCPDADSDGVADKQDDCPLLAGDLVSKGCPTVNPELVTALNEAKTGWGFEKGKAVLPADANEKLNRVALLMQEHPEYKLIIWSHSSAEGEVKDNIKLTQERADGIRFYLIGKGVANTRLQSFGLGEMEPVADINTKEGNALNERIEFNVKF